MATGNPYPKGTLEYTEWENEHPNGEDTEEQTNRVGKENDTLEVAGGTTPTPSTPVMQTPPVVQAPTATEPTPATPAATTPQQKRYGTYDDIYAYLRSEMERNRAETDDERKKREKREKTQAIISGIADMGSALSNLGWATQGAPNMYDPKEGMSPKYQELFDKKKAEREAKRERYLHAMNMMATLKDREAAREQAEAELERKVKKDEAEQTRKDNLAKAQTAAYTALEEYRNSATEKNYQQAAYWQEKAKYLGLGYDDDHAESLAKQAANNALAEYRRVKAQGTVTTEETTDQFGGKKTTQRTTTPAQQPKPTSGKKTLPNGKKKLPNQQ